MVNLNSDQRIWDGLRANDWTLEAKNRGVTAAVVSGKGIDYNGESDKEMIMVDVHDETRVWDKLKAKDWNAEAKRVLKATLKRRGVTYAQLCDLLIQMGVSETEANLKNKISRGGFSFAFCLQCMAAIGDDSIYLGRDYMIEVDLQF